VWAPVVVKLDLVTDHARGVLLTLEAMPVDALFLQGTGDALHHAVLLRAVPGNELLPQAVAANRRVKWRLVKTNPLSERSRNGAGTRPNMPIWVIRACSRAAAAVLALPLRDRCQPSSCRMWQSTTRARLSQPSRPPQTRHRFVAQCSSGRVATEGRVWIRADGPRPACVPASP
jgi:hypothetical protein